MGRRPKSRPSFFKFIRTPSTPYLQLPPAFVEKYGEILGENAKLRARSGDTWNVKLVRVGDEYRFKRGWTEFAIDVGLRMGEFVVFWFNVDTVTFDVVVVGINGCERQISAGRQYSLAGASSDSDEDVKLITDTPEVKDNQLSRPIVVALAGSQAGRHRMLEEAHPNFEVTLKGHHKARLWVRQEFWSAAGLMNERAVVLQYPPKQRCWPVLLHWYRYSSEAARVGMGAGWNEFRKSNGLAIGKTYFFEYIPDKNVIEVKPIN